VCGNDDLRVGFGREGLRRRGSCSSPLQSSSLESELHVLLALVARLCVPSRRLCSVMVGEGVCIGFWPVSR
jgi:hypothetical protein